jgi:hypothetical protein
MNSQLRYILIVTAKNAVNAVLVTAGPAVHFHYLNKAGLEHIVWLMGSAVLARELAVWGPKLVAWSVSPTKDPDATAPAKP